MRKKKKLIIILSIVAVAIFIGAGFFLSGRKNKTEYTTARAEKGSLIQTVSEVGVIKAAQEIELNFLQNGRVGKVFAKIGDNVKTGDILAELDYSSLLIREKEARASLQVAQANLNKLIAGATASQIAINDAQVSQARTNYLSALDELDKVKRTVQENISQAEKSLSDLELSGSDTVTPSEQSVITAQTNLTNAKNTYQQSISNKRNTVLSTIDDKLAVANTALDNINTLLTDSDAEDFLSVKDESYLRNARNYHASSLVKLSAATNSLSRAEFSTTDVNVNQANSDSISALNETFKALDYSYGALEKSITSYEFSQADLNAYKTIISSQSALVSSGILAVQTAKHNFEDALLAYTTNVSSAEDTLSKAIVALEDTKRIARDNLASTKLSGEQQIAASQAKAASAKEAWDVAKAQLTEIKSPARSQDVSLNQAQVNQAEAALNLVLQQIEESIIRAPIDCSVVKVNYEAGEQVNATKPAINVLGENNFEIEIDISEADITKVHEGNPVEITLDAFGDDVKFNGQVYFIEPAETIIQDVIYYKVKVAFSDPKEKLSDIKSGMTANASITTAKKDGVIMIPSRAVVEKTEGKFVRVLQGGAPVEKKVEIGLRGDEGMIETLSGVKEGDEVVTFVKTEK